MKSILNHIAFPHRNHQYDPFKIQNSQFENEKMSTMDFFFFATTSNEKRTTELELKKNKVKDILMIDL